MKNEQDQDGIHLYNPTGEVIIRKGEALPAKANKSIDISGTLGAPAQFLAGRGEIDEKNAHLKIHSDTGKLILVLQDIDPHTTHTITGSLKKDSVLEQFKINSEHRWTNAEFLKFIKTMRFYFPDKEQHKSLVDSLQKWTVGINRVIEEHNNNTGNSKFLYETKIQGVPLQNKFNIEVPIFQGYKKHKFTVEVGLDPKAVQVDLFLISDELIELEIGVREKIMQEELAKFEDKTFSKVVIS